MTMEIRRQNGNAVSLLQILFCTRRRLLACADLKAKCALSARARTTCAIACVGAFFGMIAIVLGFRAVPFEWVPVLFGGAFALFFISTLLAYRFGRLCNAEIGPSRKNAIAYLRSTSTVAEAYYQNVLVERRPITCLDLDEMRRIS